MVSGVMRWLAGQAPGLLLLAALAGLAPAALADGAERTARTARTARLGQPPAAPAADDPNQARVIVKYRPASALARSADGARAQHAGQVGSRRGLPLVDGRPLGPHTQGLRGHGLSSRQLAARLAAQPDVEWAVVDERRTITAVPNDPYYGGGQTSITPAVGQWYLRRPDSTLVAAINAEAAWDINTGSAGITVAVLDTGVRLDHPDLLGKLHPGYDFVSRDTTARDGDGRDADPSDPGDWSVAGDTCGAADSSWHGTQVAGLVGAHTGNGIGMASVGRDVMVLPVRVLGKCGGFDSDIQAAMLWAAGLSNSAACTARGAGAAVAADCNPHPARVINLSLGSPGSCTLSYQSTLAQLTAAHVVIVVAAGNSTGLAVNSPANCADAIAVAGVRHAGTKVGYSSLGPQVALAAPAGNCVNDAGACLYPLLSTDNAGLTSPGANVYSDSFRPSLGTSFSSPLVAGTVGLMLSLDPKLTPAQVRSILKATTRRFPTTGAQTVDAPDCQAPSSTQQVECYCTTTTCGAGLLDAGAALASVAASALPTAVISVSNSNPTAGASVTLDGSGSSTVAGRSVASYRWTLTSGSSLASLTGATDGRTAVLATQAAGEVQVSLTVTDSAGASHTSRQTVTIAAPVVVQPPAAGSNTGGGALGAGWLLGLGAAVLALQFSPRSLRTPRSPRRAACSTA